MSRNFSFDTTSNIYMSRSKFDQSHMVKTSLKVGKLTPVDVVEVLPGDGWYMKMRSLLRLSTAFLRPVMDNFYVDTYHFFVPLRLLYDDYESVFGNAAPNAYIDNDLGEFPKFEKGLIVPEKTVGDYLGLPTKGVTHKGVSVLKFRAFAEIYEQWFRNQNTVQPMFVQKGEVMDSEYPNGDEWSPSNYAGQLPYVSKKNDYFTSCLPAPQKGAPVNIGVSSFPALSAPVYSSTPSHGIGSAPLHFYNSGEISTSDLASPFIVTRTSVSSRDYIGAVDNNGTALSENAAALYPSNLWASIPETSLQSVNVNDLRFAIQMQKMLEKDARGGSRYREYILTHFGVANADARMQVPEYLGGMRTPLNLQQVAQTSEGTSTSPIGSLGAYSQSYSQSRFSKSFTEHGFVFTLAVVRYKHSYQQGIDKSFFRSKREDFYDPLFANLGEQPVYKSQLYGYAPSDAVPDNAPELTAEPFGYNEAYADYRYRPDIVTGEMRSNAQNSFDIWHFSDNYNNAPTLTQSFTDENPEFFRRTTAIGSEADVDDFLAQFYFDGYVLRSMPIRSIPGLVDHH